MAEELEAHAVGHHAGVWEDLKELPSWVWLGAAAAAGLLFVLSRAGGGAATTTQQNTAAPASSIPTVSGTQQDTSLYNQLSTMISQMQGMEAAAYNPSLPPTVTGTGTSGAGTTTIPPATGSGGTGEPPWNVQQLGSNILAFSSATTGGQPNSFYVLSNGAWQPQSSGQISALFAANGSGSTTGTPYNGPGNYFGTQVPAIPGT